MSEEKKQFQVGDTVELRSGGPVMTVTMVPDGADGLVWTSWFDRGDWSEICTDSFHPASLKLVTSLEDQ